MRVFRGLSRGAPESQVGRFLAGAGYRAVLFLILTVCAGFFQGAGLLLLIPLLQIIGIGQTGGASGGIAHWIGRGFASLGLQLNLPLILLAFVLLMTVQAFFLFSQATLGTSLVQSFLRSIRNDLFRSVATAPLSRLTGRRASDLLHLMTHDVTQVGIGSQRVMSLARDSIISLVFVALSLVISVPLCLLALLCGGILLVCLRPLNRTSEATGMRLRDRMQRLTADVDDLLSSMKLVKAFGREATAIERFTVTTDGTLSEQLGFVEARSWTQVFSQTGGALTLALFVFLASEWLHIPASEYLVMILLFSRLLPRVSTLQESWQFIRHIRPSLEAIERTLQELEARREVPLSTGSIPFPLREKVEFRDVVFRYLPDVEPAVREINLRIPAGKITAIVGPSGSGKTTLADLIAGLTSPEAGVVTVDDRPLAGDLVMRWRRCVGYVPQESFLFHDTIRANLLWARPGADQEELWEALRMAHADQFVARFPQGLDTIVRDRGGRLSGGERQRIALARALLIRPTLLLLDEATSEVDPRSQEEILSTVRGLRGRMTIVIIAHHAPIEGMADQLLVLDQGRLGSRRCGSPELGTAGTPSPRPQ